MKYILIVMAIFSCGIINSENPVTTTQAQYVQCTDPGCSCKTKCQHCPQDDPMEETLKIVLAAIPDVFANFIQIVQDPNNKDNIVQSLSTIFAHIIRIATSAFRRDEIDHKLRSIILSQAAMVRALALK